MTHSSAVKTFIDAADAIARDPRDPLDSKIMPGPRQRAEVSSRSENERLVKITRPQRDGQSKK